MRNHVTGARWWVCGALTVLALSASSGCKVEGAAAGTAHQESQQQKYQHAVSRVTIDLDSGDITLHTGSGGQVSVQRSLKWDSTKPTVTEGWTGDTLAITARCASGEHSCAADYQVDLPADVTVVAKTNAGNVTTRGIHGGQELRSDAGDLTVKDSGGALTLHTNNGRVTGTGLAAAQVDAGTDAGDVNLTLTTVPDSLTAKSSAGDIDLLVPKTDGGYAVQAGTNAGAKRVLVDTSGSSKRRIVATTDSGDVQVRYAP